MNAATTCNTCHHAARPLPTDWTVVEFFDRAVVAQEAVFRTACTAVPDAEKPCLKPAPAANTITLTERQKIGLQANYQTEALLRALAHSVTTGDTEALPYLVQAMAPRLLVLNDISMAAIADGEPLDSLRERLQGGAA